MLNHQSPCTEIVDFIYSLIGTIIIIYFVAFKFIMAVVIGIS